jgi:hypothetical protein
VGRGPAFTGKQAALIFWRCGGHGQHGAAAVDHGKRGFERSGSGARDCCEASSGLYGSRNCVKFAQRRGT